MAGHENVPVSDGSAQVHGVGDSENPLFRFTPRRQLAVAAMGNLLIAALARITAEEEWQYVASIWVGMTTLILVAIWFFCILIDLWDLEHK